MSSGGGAGPLVPTFHGFVHNSMDGLVLFEACLSGKLHHVPRRPHDRERNSLIKSGSIFIYEENASGIKRWTDGVAWSPSRILGNFLIYRELEKPFPPGEKKRAMKRKRSSIPGEPYPRRDSVENESAEVVAPLTPPSPSVGGEVKPEMAGGDHDKELERSLIGSLVDSYGFRPDGLVKKTMSISVNGISHHMVSYYKVDDVKNNALPRPLSDPRLANISVRPELYLKQNFRAPVEETEHYAIDGQMHAHPQMMYSSMAAGAYGVRPGQYFGQQYPPCALQPTSAASMYGGMTGTSWGMQPTTTSAMPYSAHPVYAHSTYADPYYKHGAGQAGAPAVKPEESPAQTSTYGAQYASSYPSMQRPGTQGTPSMHASAYPTPVHQGSSTFGSISAHSSRPSYGSATEMNGTSSNGQVQHSYPGAAASQSYAVRSPPQNYALHSSSSSAVAPSPHPSIKSPLSVTHATTPSISMSGADPNAHLHTSHMPYRSNSYVLPSTPQSTHSGAGDMAGLGISGNGHGHYAPQAHHGGPGYHAYGASAGQSFRPISELAVAQAGAQYAQ